MANNRIRYNWGVCTNRDVDGNGTPCECYASKERQRVLASHEFVCRVCGEPLQRVQPPKSFVEKYKGLLIGLAAVVVVGGVGAGIAFSGGRKDKAPVTAEKTAKDEPKADTAIAASSEKQAPASAPAPVAASANSTEETTEQKATVTKKENCAEPTKVIVVEKTQTASSSRPQASSSTRGSKNLGYAVYRGGLKGGRPDDVNGRLTFKSSHVIDSRDPKGRVADPGDYVIGEFSEGHLVQGIWYGSDNVVKGSIIIGK